MTIEDDIDIEPTVDDYLAELTDRGWGGWSENRRVEIHLDGSSVRVELHWTDEARTNWGISTESYQYEEGPTLLAALAMVMIHAVPDEGSIEIMNDLIEAEGGDPITAALGRVNNFITALKRDGIHVGIGNPPVCAACDQPWPCSHEQGKATS